MAAAVYYRIFTRGGMLLGEGRNKPFLDNYAQAFRDRRGFDCYVQGYDGDGNKVDESPSVRAEEESSQTQSTA